jgi:hypothetical protein
MKLLPLTKDNQNPKNGNIDKFNRLIICNIMDKFF